MLSTHLQSLVTEFGQRADADASEVLKPADAATIHAALVDCMEQAMALEAAVIPPGQRFDDGEIIDLGIYRRAREVFDSWGA